MHLDFNLMNAKSHSYLYAASAVLLPRLPSQGSVSPDILAQLLMRNLTSRWVLTVLAKPPLRGLEHLDMLNSRTCIQSCNGLHGWSATDVPLENCFGGRHWLDGLMNSNWTQMSLLQKGTVVSHSLWISGMKVAFSRWVASLTALDNTWQISYQLDMSWQYRYSR